MSNTTARIAVAYHSGYGHTAKQAEAVAAGVGGVPGAVADLVPLDELTDEVWSRLAQADAIIFGAPTYMGSPSAVFKAFAEASAAVWADNLGWRDKIAAGFTNSKAMSGDKLNSLVDFAVLAAQHGMIWVGLDLYPGWATSTASIEDLNRLGSWLGAMAQSDADLSAEKAPPETDLRTAAALGARVATVTIRHLRGSRPDGLVGTVGSVGVVMLGVVLFDEPLTPIRITCIALIVAGGLGLGLAGSH